LTGWQAVTEQLTIVDAHQHFWDPERNYHPWLADKPVAFRYGDYSAIKRRYLPDDYLRDARNYRVAGTVYVETEWDPRDPIGEMDYVAMLRRDTGYPSVAVAQAWLDRDDAVPVLERLSTFEFVRGVRQKPRVNTAPRDGSAGGMMDAAWREGFAALTRLGLRYDLQTPWWHLHEAADVARAFPDTQIILNHTGLPADRSAEGIAAWGSAMAQLADCPNVAVKISGLGQPAKPWTAAVNRQVVLRTIDLFGPERCMFASNFPVDSLCGTFDEIFSGFDAITRDFSDGERQQMFSGNPVRIYDIPRDTLRTPIAAEAHP
jgi:predicted TIM-barrel fold metal-dependent hydrolase